MSKEKAIYKTTVDGRSEWVHASRQGNTVNLRWFGRTPFKFERLDLTEEGDHQRWDNFCTHGTKFTIGEIATRTARLGYSATALKVEGNQDRWTEVFTFLLSIGDTFPDPQIGIHQPARAVSPVAGDEVQVAIPLTRMRRFYETLRMLNKSKLQQGIAEYLTKRGRADRIQVIFQESESHFQRYSNTSEAFHNRQNPDWWAAYLNNPQQFAKCTIARLCPNKDHLPVNVHGWGDVHVVDYEISPFRTTVNAVFEDGTKGSGGGMDLLLKDVVSCVPIIGEIKASTDRDLFLALIQSLTYAAELTTTNQLDRLSRHYGAFNFETRDSQCDIFLIYDKHGKEPKLMDQTKTLAKQLLAEPSSPVARRIRRLAVVSADLNANTGIDLACEWSTPIR